MLAVLTVHRHQRVGNKSLVTVEFEDPGDVLGGRETVENVWLVGALYGTEFENNVVWIGRFQLQIELVAGVAACIEKTYRRPNPKHHSPRSGDQNRFRPETNRKNQQNNQVSERLDRQSRRTPLAGKSGQVEQQKVDITVWYVFDQESKLEGWDHGETSQSIPPVK